MAFSSDNMSDFECSICCDILEDPRLLPCGHMFCGPARGCITDIGANRTIVECPNCRKTHCINVNNLQPIYVLKNFLEGQKSASAAKTTSEPGPLSEVKNACEVHSEQSLSYFCEDCAITICEVCWGNDHAGHVVMLLKVKQRKEVTEAIEKADLQSLVRVYDKVIDDNRKRRQLVLEVLTETDVVNQLLASRKNDLAELENRCKEFRESTSAKGEHLGESLLSDLQKHFESNSDDNIKVTIKHISQESQKKFNRFVSSCSQNEKNLNELNKQRSEGKVEMKDPENIGAKSGKGDAEREQSAAKLMDELESMKLKPASKSVVGESNLKNRGANGSQRVSSVSSAFLNPELDSNLPADKDDDNDSSASEDRKSCASTSVLTENNSGNAKLKKERARRGKKSDASSAVGGTRGGRGGGSRGGAPPPARPFRPPPPPMRPAGPGPRNFRPPPHLTGFGPLQPPIPPPVQLAPNSSFAATGSGGDQILEIKGCLVFIRGDIFQSKHSIAYSISQELNFNYGLSVEIAKRFSPIPKLARQSKKSGGDVHFFTDSRTNPQRYIYTLVTALQGKNKCSFYSLEKCLQAMQEHASRNNVKTICVPATLACEPQEGLDWNSVELVIKSTFTGTDINVFIYS
ncbi:uncharacterized protein LOC142337700 isoform X2 [Convolutriloba macropyga]|uniref:uncharacterized protein LOC142337700 isoform X2 n=1 Tax=Convolutriloba macropyga TaxID=536237 RepID=UPI003F51E541